MADVTSDARLVHGSVKWFDPAKGYGFVVADSGGPDILLHVNVLRNFGQSSVADGSRIEVLAHSTSRGVQATEVTSITPPDNCATAELSDFATLDPEEVQQAPLEPARVKWFDKGKGLASPTSLVRPKTCFCISRCCAGPVLPTFNRARPWRCG